MQAQTAAPNPNVARGHLAIEQALPAWIGSNIVFRCAISRLAIAIRQGFACFSSLTILSGILFPVAAFVGYRRNGCQINGGQSERSGFLIDLAGVFHANFGFAPAGYLLYAEET